MEDLYLETENGNIPIDQEVIEKYNLKKGSFSPFTHKRIIDKNGDYILEKQPTEYATLDGNQDDPEFHEMENGFMLSTSEMIDIAEGVDSSS